MEFIPFGQNLAMIGLKVIGQVRMWMLKAISCSVLSWMLLSACSQQPLKDQMQQPLMMQQPRLAELNHMFQAVGSAVVFVTYDGEKLQRFGNDLQRAVTAYIPASTFKMLNALIVDGVLRIGGDIKKAIVNDMIGIFIFGAGTSFIFSKLFDH